jgi:hypothetical protein
MQVAHSSADPSVQLPRHVLDQIGRSLASTYGNSSTDFDFGEQIRALDRALDVRAKGLSAVGSVLGTGDGPPPEEQGSQQRSPVQRPECDEMENPTCPNCGRPMHLLVQPAKQEDQHTFRCDSCGIVYLTPDHVPITGRLDRNEGPSR